MKQINLVYNRTEKESRLDRQWSRITSIKPVLTMLVLLMVALFGVNEKAWGGQAHVYVYSSPQNYGYVDVQTSNSAPSSYTLNKDHEEQGGFGSSGNKTFYLFYKAKSGYRFVNWYKTSENNYNNGTTVTNSSDLTSQGQSVTQSATGFGAQNSYYAAVFKGNSYTVSFAGNGNTSGSMSDQSGFVYGTAKTLSTNTFGRAYTVTYDANGGSCGTSSATATYTFNGWKSSDGTSYADKASVSTFSPTPAHGATVTLTAQWTSASVTLPNATKDGAVLDGWYSGDTKIGDPGDAYTPTANITLTAKWINKYTFEITGDNYTINNEAWNKTPAFTFVHADEVNMTTTIEKTDVISYDRAKNTITALKIGTSKITFTQNTSSTVDNGTIVFTITVDSVANNLSVSGTSFTKYVDQEVTSVRSNQNSNGEITTTSSNPNLAHYDISNNKIVIPNSDAQELPFDDVTITISQAPTAKYKAKKHTITLTVQKWPSSIDGTLGASNLMVEGGTSIGSYTTSNVEAGDPAEGDSNDYYYTISHSLPDGATTTGCATGHSSHVIGFNPSTKAITAYNAGTARLTITQKETYRYTGATKSFEVTVHKYNNSFSATANYNKKVDETQASDYVWTYAKPDAAYPGDADHNAGTPGKGSESGNFYYTIDHEFPEDAITTGCPAAYVDSIITYVASTKTATARNAGRATVTLHQKETFKYKAASNSFTVTVTKWDNPLDVVGNSAHWAANIYPDRTWENKELRSTYNNADYTTFPISVVQYAGNTPGKEIMTYEYNQSTRKITFHSNYRLGTAKWRFTQPENYKYLAGEDSIRLTVIHAPEATDCYVLENDDSKKSDYHGHTIHEHTWDYEHSAGVATFEISQDALGIDQAFRVQQYLNGEWQDVTGDRTDYNTSWQWRTETLDRDAKGIRFWVKGSVLNYIRNVSVKRAIYLEAEDTIRIAKTADLNPVYPSDVPGSSQLTVAHSLANGGNLKITNDNPKFTLSASTITKSDCSEGRDTIALTYASSVAGNDTAHLIIYNDVYRDTVVLIGTCVKHHQAGSWKENIETLPKGVKVGNAYTSTTSGTHGVTYRVITGTSVTVDGDTLIASTSGKSTVVAEVAEDDMYYAIADTIEIEVTNDLVQYIVWNQDYELAHLEEDGANVVLNAYADSETESCSTNGAYSENARPITYSIEGGGTSVVQIVNGNELQINGAGTAYVRATQAGGTDYDGHSYASTYMRKKVVVRGPNDPCGEYYLYNLNDSTQWRTDDASKLRQETVNGEAILFEGKGNKTRYSNTFSFAPAYAILYAKKEKGGGSATIEQYIPGEGWTSTGYSRTTFNNGSDGWPSAPDTISLSRNATQVRAVLSQSRNHIYMGGLKVVIAEFATIAEDVVEKDTLVFSANVKTRQSKDVAVHRYSKDALFLSLPENAPFMLNKEDISKNCRPDTTDLRITFNPDVAMTDSCFNLAIKENGVTLKTIVLKATAKPDTCTYGADGNWTEDDEHWSKMPNENTNATIEAGVDVVVSTKVSVYSLKLEEGATLTVTPTGGLTVGAGGIEGATEDNIVLQVDDDDESADFGKTGYVRVSPKHTGAMPQATIEAFSKAYKQAGDTKWQYIGSPIQEKVLAKTVFTNSYIYTWDESQGTWLNKRSSMKLEPFKGYATTQKADAKGIKLTFQGTLVEPKDTMITLYKDGANSYSGYNVLANSYSAPIDISRLQPDDFSEGVEATIHLFNTGSQAELEARTEAAVVSVTAAGQYISVPVASARVLHTLSDYPIIIPSMQGFYVKTSQAGTLTLNYERLVWNADYSKHTNEPLRIKRREAEEKDEDALTGTLKVTLYTPTEVDHLIFIESEKRDAAYENGYDAHKMMSGDMNVFSVEDEEYMSVDATNSIIGTRVGVRTGNSDMYTIAFSKVNSERAMMLVDMEADKTVAIEEEAEYTFFAEPNSTITERFIIVERAEVPGVATGCDNVSEGAKAHKFVKDDQMYILKNGVLYNVMGTVVK